MRFHPAPLGEGQWAGLEEDVVGYPDLADVVEQEPVLRALVVGQLRLDRPGQLDGVAHNPLRVGPGAGVFRLERSRERRDGLVVGALEQVALAALDLEQMPEIARVEKQLLLGLALLRRAEGDSVQATGEPLDDRQQFEWAERLAQEGLCAGIDGGIGGATVRAAQDDDRDRLRRGVALELPAKGEPVHTGQVDVEDDRVRVPFPDRRQRARHVRGLLELDVDSVECCSKERSQSGIVINKQKTQGFTPYLVSAALLSSAGEPDAFSR